MTSIPDALAENLEIEIGKPSKASGEYAFRSLQKAVEALNQGEIDILLTAPIDKHNIQSEEFDFEGHTEYLESKIPGESLMILMSEGLRVGLITGHIPIKEVSEKISEELIIKKVGFMHKSLKQDFSFRWGHIARNHFHGCTFSSAIWPKKTYNFTRFYLKRDIVNSFLITINFRKIFNKYCHFLTFIFLRCNYNNEGLKIQPLNAREDNLIHVISMKNCDIKSYQAF